MADARFTSQQLAQMLRRLDDVMSQAQSVRHAIIEAMAARRRKMSTAGLVPPRKNARGRNTR